jgi:serine/threonine-protein kinase
MAPTSFACALCPGTSALFAFWSESKDSWIAQEAKPRKLADHQIAALCPMCWSGGQQFRKIGGPSYLVAAEIARGGMGAVFKALRFPDKKVLALKMLTSLAAEVYYNMEPALRDRALEVQMEAMIRRESAILGHLRALGVPYVAQYQKIFHLNGSLCLLMNFVEGTNLGDMVEDTGPVPVAKAVGWIVQVLEGLAFVHDENYVHRDIKPANIIVDAAGRVTLVDFGLARECQYPQISNISTGQVWGTLDFMAPEQMHDYRNVGLEADIYSIGATLYYMLTQKTAYDFPPPIDLTPLAADERKSLVDSKAHLLCESKEFIPISNRAKLPRRLVAAIHKTLERDPKKRRANFGFGDSAPKPPGNLARQLRRELEQAL